MIDEATGPTKAELMKREVEKETVKALVENPKTIAFDFDGVLAHYDGWRGHDHLGKPIPGMKNLLCELKDCGWTIIIYTTRGNAEIQEWCDRHKIPFDYVNFNPAVQGNNPGKPIADIYVDDRAIKFNGVPTDLRRQIAKFQTWNIQLKRFQA